MRSPGKDACVATEGIFADHRKAKLLSMRGHEERAWALRKLRAKYPQYAGRMLPNDAPIMRITPDRTAFRGKA